MFIGIRNDFRSFPDLLLFASGEIGHDGFAHAGTVHGIMEADMRSHPYRIFGRILLVNIHDLVPLPHYQMDGFICNPGQMLQVRPGGGKDIKTGKAAAADFKKLQGEKIFF